jgi:hypothetical protein
MRARAPRKTKQWTLVFRRVEGPAAPERREALIRFLARLLVDEHRRREERGRQEGGPSPAEDIHG